MSAEPQILHHFVDGRRVEGKSNRFGDVYNPATGAVASRVPFATAAEVRAAVESSLAAFPGWAATPPAQRARILFRYRDLLDAHKDEIAQILTADGVPHSWQGTTLLVHDTLEETVDALLEEVETAGERGLDPDEP